MKKLLCILVAVGVLFCFASCGMDPSDSESGNSISAQEMSTTSSDETLGFSISGSYDSYDLPGFSSLVEYEQYFANQGGYPEGFITYDMLKMLGGFDGFVAQSYYGENPDYSLYHYSILHPSGITFAVDISPVWLPRNQFDWDIVSIKDTMIESDLRTNPTAEMRGTVLIEDFLYTYLLGNLSAVKWISGEMNICVSGDFEQIVEVTEDSLIDKLLNYNTAKAAISELKEITKSGFCDYQGISSFAEYQASYMNSTGYSEELISYDDLKWLGNFEGFVTTSGVSIYFLQHPSGVDITVYLYPENDVPQAEWVLQTSSVENTQVSTDLRTNNTSKDVGRLTFGNAIYIYRSGKLSAIQWKSNEKLVRVSAEFDKLPENLGDTYLKKMLSATYAESTITEIKK